MSTMVEEGDKEVETRIKKINEALQRPGIKREEVIAFYDKWAETYDEGLLLLLLSLVVVVVVVMVLIKFQWWCEYYEYVLILVKD